MTPLKHGHLDIAEPKYNSAQEKDQHFILHYVYPIKGQDFKVFQCPLAVFLAWARLYVIAALQTG